jgi:predicted Zn-dependent peptidase
VAKRVVRFDNPNLYKEEFEKLKNLTEADIIRVANKYFNSSNRTVGHVLPEKK